MYTNKNVVNETCDQSFDDGSFIMKFRSSSCKTTVMPFGVKIEWNTYLLSTTTQKLPIARRNGKMQSSLLSTTVESCVQEKNAMNTRIEALP